MLLSLGPKADKYRFADEASIIRDELRLPIYATRGTAEMLKDIGIPCTAVEKNYGAGVSGLDLIDQGRVDFVINVAREYDRYGRPDGYLIRRHAIDAGVPLVTDLSLARAIVEALHMGRPSSLSVMTLQDYVEERR